MTSISPSLLSVKTEGGESKLASPILDALQRLDGEFTGGIGDPMALEFLEGFASCVSLEMESSRSFQQQTRYAEMCLEELRQSRIDDQEKREAWMIGRVATLEENAKIVAQNARDAET